MAESIKQIATICGGVASIVSAVVLCVKPLREKVFGLCEIFRGLKCMLRSDMLRTYYKHNADEKIRQHERENFEAEYRAYKALGGNSFIDEIHEEVAKWKILS